MNYQAGDLYIYKYNPIRENVVQIISASEQCILCEQIFSKTLHNYLEPHFTPHFRKLTEVDKLELL